MTIQQLEELLYKQKQLTAQHITRNLTVYHWYGKGNQVDIDKAKEELKSECMNSPNEGEFEILKKYLSPE